MNAQERLYLRITGVNPTELINGRYYYTMGYVEWLTKKANAADKKLFVYEFDKLRKKNGKALFNALRKLFAKSKTSLHGISKNDDIWKHMCSSITKGDGVITGNAIDWDDDYSFELYPDKLVCNYTFRISGRSSSKVVNNQLKKWLSK